MIYIINITKDSNGNIDGVYTTTGYFSIWEVINKMNLGIKFIVNVYPYPEVKVVYRGSGYYIRTVKDETPIDNLLNI